MEWWAWVLLGLVLLVVELVTPGGLFALFFGMGALFVAVLTAIGVSGPATMQWLVFAAVSIVLLVLLRRHLERALRHRRKAVDGLVGEIAVPLQDLPPNVVGKAELRGTPWDARNAASSTVTRGQRCHVERVEGLTLWIRPE